MEYRHLYPMVRILLPFMVGIIVSTTVSATFEIPYFIWICLLILSIATGLIHFNKLRFVNLWLFGIIVSLFLFVTGYNSVILHKEILKPDHFVNIQSKGIFIASVIEPLQEKEHSFKTILNVTGITIVTYYCIITIWCKQWMQWKHRQRFDVFSFTNNSSNTWG